MRRIEREVHRAHRILLRTAAARAGKARDRQRVVRAKLLRRPGGERHGRLRTHSPVLQHDLFRHVEQLRLRIVTAAYAAAGEEFPGAAQVGQRLHEQTARRRLDHRELVLAVAQQIGAHLGQGVVAETEEILAQQERALGGDLLELGTVQPPAGRTDAAIDLPRMGAIGHAEGVPLPVEDRLQFVLQGAFAHARGADLHIGLPVEQQAELREPRHHLVGEHRV